MFTISNMNTLDKNFKSLEFLGDVGSDHITSDGQSIDVNKIKDRALEVFTSEEIKVKKLKDPAKTIQAIEQDKANSIKFNELIDDPMIGFIENEVQKKAETLDPEEKSQILENFAQIKGFFGKIKDLKVDRFLVDTPHNFIYLDGTAGMCEPLPVVNSYNQLPEGASLRTLMENLAVDMIERGYQYTEPNRVEKVNGIIESHYTPEVLLDLFESNCVEMEDLKLFSSPIGAIIIYFLYHALYLHKLENQGPLFRKDLNLFKKIFRETIGNNQARAENIGLELARANTSVFFTQECDELVRVALECNYDLPKEQILDDGTHVFLKKGEWENVQVVNKQEEAFNLSEWTKKGKINAVFAQNIKSQEHFLFVAAHGHSKVEEDAQKQLEAIHQTYQKLKEKYPNIQLVIGIDANCKKTAEAFEAKIEELKLCHTGSLGVTTRKERALTVMFTKAGVPVEAKGDYLISSKPLVGAHLGIASEVDSSAMLPNINNRSDHFAVTASV